MTGPGSAPVTPPSLSKLAKPPSHTSLYPDLPSPIALGNLMPAAAAANASSHTAPFSYTAAPPAAAPHAALGGGSSSSTSSCSLSNAKATRPALATAIADVNAQRAQPPIPLNAQQLALAKKLKEKRVCVPDHVVQSALSIFEGNEDACMSWLLELENKITEVSAWTTVRDRDVIRCLLLANGENVRETVFKITSES